MAQGAIVAHTERIADELKKHFKQDPAGELSAWLAMAQQREAMVTRVYGLTELQRRIPDQGDTGAASIAVKAIKGIWVQEEVHTTFIRSVRLAVGDPTVALDEIRGKLEGDVTRSASAGGLLARLIIAIGASLDLVPSFAGEIDAMSLREFFTFCGELEDTAGRGYERMVELSKKLKNQGVDDNPILPLPYELAKILTEERYHAVVFQCLLRWLDADGCSFRQISPRSCVEELHALAAAQFDLAVVRHVLKRTRGTLKGARANRWISHGGLQDLFTEFQLSAPVAMPAESIETLA